MNKGSVLSALFCLYGFIGFGQSLDTKVLDSLANKHDLLYTDKDGDYFGCGLALECTHMKVVFYEAVFDKKQRSIRARGRVFGLGPTTPNDTVGAALTTIFLAQPKGDKLYKIRRVSESYVRGNGDKHQKAFPFEAGDFEIDFKFGEEDRLYFNCPMYRPLEYNIGTLLKE